MLRSLSVAALLPVVLAAISAPLLARLMSPADRGLLGAGLATTTIAGAIGVGGVQQALARGLGGSPPPQRWYQVVRAARRASMTAVPASVGAFIWVRLAVESDLSFAVVTAMAVLVVVVATGARSVLHGMGAHHLSNFALAGEAVLRLVLIAAAWVAVSTLSPAAGVVLMIVIPPTVTVAAAIPTTMQLHAGRR